MSKNRKDSDDDPISPRQVVDNPVSPRQIHLQNDESLDKSGAQESYYDNESDKSSTGKKTIKKQQSERSSENQRHQNTAQKLLPQEEIEISMQRQTNELDTSNLGKNRSTQLLQAENEMNDLRQKKMLQTDGQMGKNRSSKFPEQATEMMAVSKNREAVAVASKVKLAANQEIDENDSFNDQDISSQKEQQLSKQQMMNDLNGTKGKSYLSKSKKLSEEDRKNLMKSVSHLKQKDEANQSLKSKKFGKVDGLPRKIDDFVLDEDVEPVSYLKLVNHINQMHPQKPFEIKNKEDPQEPVKNGEMVFSKKLGESFGLCDQVGSLLLSTYCKCLKEKLDKCKDQKEKEEDNADGIQNNDITPMAKEIGLGSTLFLMNINALMYFFALLTIVNIPLMVVFANGTSLSTNRGINSAFVSLSLGNLGGRTDSCSQINLRSLYGKTALNQNLSKEANSRNYGLRDNLTLSCSQGNHLGNLKLISLYNGKDQICQNLNQFGPDDLYKIIDTDCIYNETIDTLFEKIILNQSKQANNNTPTFATFGETYLSFLNDAVDGISIPFLTNYTKQFSNDLSKIPFASENPLDNQFLYIPSKNMSFGYQISAKCYKKLSDMASSSTTEPYVVMIAQCEPDTRTNPWTGKVISRSQLGIMVTFLDFLNIFLIMSFAICLKRAQQKYVKEFDSETLDLSDFSIRVKGMPHQEQYEDVEKFRAILIAHFESLVIQRRAIKEARYKATLDDENAKEQQNEEQYKKDKEGDVLSKNIVADVCFGQSNLDHTIPLLIMQDSRQQVLRAKRGLEKTKNGCMRWCLQKQVDWGNKNFEKRIDLYYKAKGLAQQEPEKPVEKTNVSAIPEKEEILDNEGGEVAEEKGLKKKATMSRQKQLKEQAFTYAKHRYGEKEMQYAYVVFRQMSDVDLVLKVYEKYGASRRCCMCCVSFCKCCYNNPKFQKWRDEYESLQVYGRFFDIKRASDPSMIKWNNLGTSKLRRCACISLNWIIALLLMAMTLIGVVYLKWQTDQMEASLLPKVNCPIDSGDDVFKQLVIQDRSLFEKSQILGQSVSEKDDVKYLNLKNCYCQARFKTDLLNIRNIEFNIPIDNNGNNKMMYLCNDWLTQFLSVKAVVPSSAVVIVILNMIIANFVIFMTTLEKLQTEEDETRNTFMKLQILQFINTALIILSVNFNFYSYENRNRWFLGFIPIFNGKFTDFVPDWYNRVGAILCLSMFIQIFSPHVSKILMAFIQWIRQNMDRGGRKVPLEKPTSEMKEDRVDVNTQKLIQDDLNILYTGPEIPVHYVYSQQFTYLWCLLMFSTGMPVMYLIGTGVFFSFYWVYKGLILKVYQKSTKFNHEMPLQNQGYTEIAIFLHVIVGGIMVSQPNIFSEPDDEETLKHFGGLNVAQNSTFSQTKYFGSGMPSNFFARYTKTVHSQIYFAFVFFFLVWFFAKSTALSIIEEIFEYLFTTCKCLQKLPCYERPKSEELLSNNFYADLDIEHLKNIYEKSLIEQDKIDELQEFKKDSKGVSECKYTLKQLKEQMASRVIMIEKTIDNHLKLLHDNDGFDEINLQDGVNYTVKLKYLENYSEQLKALQKVCRMVNITQSFDIYQSMMYKKCRVLELDIESKLHPHTFDK